MIDVRALIRRRQERTVPENGKANWTPRAEDDITGQVFVFSSQSIQKPGPHAGTGGKNGAVVHHQQRRPMIGIVAVHRSQHANVVDVLGEFGQQFANRHTTFPPRCELERRRQQSTGRPLGPQIGPFGTLPGIFQQRRFGVKQVSLKRAAVHKQMDDTFCARREMRLKLASRRVLRKQVGHAQRTKPTTSRLQHPAPC